MKRFISRMLIPVMLGMAPPMLMTGCSATQKGAAIGAAGGAVTGGVIGHQRGKKEEGALIGAGVGAVTGGAIGHMMTNKFCPSCGKRYTGGHEYCSEDGTPLRYITN